MLLLSGGLFAQNSTCDAAIAIGDGTFTEAGIVAESAGVSAICFADGADAAWYAYTATTTGAATVSSSIDLDQPDTRISVYTGTCDALTCLASDDDSGEGFTSVVEFAVTAGETYLLMWDDRWDEGEFDFQVSAIAGGDDDMDGIDNLVDNCPAVANEDQADLDGDNIGDVCDEDIDGDGNLNDADCDPLDATVFVGAACDDGDPATVADALNDMCVCAGIIPDGNTVCTGALAAEQDVVYTGVVLDATGGAASICFTDGVGESATWYSYTATNSGLTTVSSSIDLDQPDTRVSIYTGGCDALTCLASDDDAGEGFTSIATFDGVAGETYLIEWDDRWDNGAFDFSITVDVPAGAGCTDATACNYDAGAADDDGSCVFATGCDSCSGETDGSGSVVDNPEVGEACDDGNASTTNDTVGEDCVDSVISGSGGAANNCFPGAVSGASWYAYTATSSDSVTVSSSIDLDTPDTRVSIYSGSCDALVCVASDDDGGEGFTSVTGFQATAGETYYIEWDERWGNDPFDFTITVEVSGGVGCIDETACNYDPLAATDDGSCVFATGCDVCDGAGGVTDNPEVRIAFVQVSQHLMRTLLVLKHWWRWQTLYILTL